MNPERKIISVSQLNREARFLLEQNFTTLWVEGEISNLSRPASGHIYFTLKDEQAQIRCAMFRNRLTHIRFRPKSGDHIQIRGSVSLYESRGDYQLIAEHMEPAGEGMLQRAFEALKKKLSQEGLFDEKWSKSLPLLAERIGVISSPSGAAIHDILTVLRRRFPALPITLYPVSVQGSTASEEIVAALEIAQQRAECDLLILARGGGSLEDLQPFNEEEVARAIHNCSIPLISAVGHETDFTIADFVADLRAPTPSAAAESVSPDRQEWQQRLWLTEQRLTKGIQSALERLSLRLDGAQGRLRHPSERLRQLNQRLDESEQRLHRAEQLLLEKRTNRLREISLRLQRQAPEQKILMLRERLESGTRQLRQSLHHRLQQQVDHLSALAHTLNAVSPLATLSRGYSITSTAEGEVLQTTTGLQKGEKIRTRLGRGEITSQVTGISSGE